MRQCTLWGTGLTWSAEWGRTAVVMPSPMPPCRENPWSYSTWPSPKTSPITYRLGAVAAGCCSGLSHFTTPPRIVKHLGFNILFLLSADKWIIAVWKTIARPLNCTSLWEQPLTVLTFFSLPLPVRGKRWRWQTEIWEYSIVWNSTAVSTVFVPTALK